jgi:hypothetical protein
VGFLEGLIVSDRKGKPRETLVSILTFEKAAQHLLTALFFLVDIPGIGKPDIGPNISISYEAMALVNLLLFGAFSLGLLGKIWGAHWSLKMIGGLAAADILLEVLFHGFFYLTVSVLVSTLLIILVNYPCARGGGVR